MSSKDPKTDLALLYLRKRCFSAFPLDELRSSFNLSASRLRHLIKTTTGLPPNRYIKHLRMRRAKELLTSTFLSVKEIMVQVGCNDPSHFIRDFKAIYGVSPGRYRLSLLEKRSDRSPHNRQRVA